ncbi:MAG: YD repeat-containing protein [Phenylobacterium sp.]|jgi:YD repeat-containing protein
MNNKNNHQQPASRTRLNKTVKKLLTIAGLMLSAITPATSASSETTAQTTQVSYQYDAMGNRIGQFNQAVLQVVDFESGTTSPFHWQHAGAAAWHIDPQTPIDGNYSLQAGAIDDDQTSITAITINASGVPLSFDLKVTATDPKTTLRFYIDNVLQDVFTAAEAINRVLYPLTPGKHQLQWVFDIPEKIRGRSGQANATTIQTLTSTNSAWIDNLYLPTISDSDNDGFNDSWEYLYFDDLNHDFSQDSDNDGLSDAQEYTAGTNPTSDDTDNDGLPDQWELEQGLSPVIADDTGLDHDSDGFTLLQEYLAGTSDNDASTKPTSSYLDFENGQLNASTPATLHWHNSTDHPWYIDNTSRLGGHYALRSGTVGYQQHSTIQTTITAIGAPLTVSFDVSSITQNTSGKLTFYIDNQQQAVWPSDTTMQSVQYPLSAGKHTLKWVYDRSSSDVFTGGTAWIDNLYIGAIFDGDKDDIADSWEYLYFDNLNHDLSLDSDNDGLSELQEYQLGTEPTNPDSDGDILPDGWEVAQNLDPNNAADAQQDNDNDGFTALQEYFAGTNDNDASSVPQIAYLDFETAVMAPLYWHHDGNQPWQIENNPVMNGQYALRSGAIINEQSSILTTTIYANGSPLSFNLMVSSERTYDSLSFTIDDVPQGYWSGEIANQMVYFPLSPGKHRLSWIYQKDQSDSEGADSSWIDNLSIPAVFDSDNDEIDDSWEYLYFDELSHDTSLDSDNDGLSDLEEYLATTNPILTDTDDDGMDDGWEINLGLNPLINDGAGDIDNNGLTNLVDYILSHPDYPIDQDSDHDGIPDIYEINHGMNPTNSADALLDNDDDGFSALQEYNAGTSDADPLSFPTTQVLDFESNNPAPFDDIGQSALNWQFDNTQAWQGLYSLRSGVISDSQSSTLSITINSTGEAVSFAFKVSSEEDYDFFSFYIDGVMQQQWSGEHPFALIEFPLAAGQHQLKWVYEKDDSASEGADTVWIDNLYLPMVE